MTLNDELAVLRSIPLFSAIRPETLRLLAFASTRMIFQSGQSLFSEGDQSANAYILLSGAATIHQQIDGQTRAIDVVAPHDIVGQTALFCSKPRQVTVTANSTVEALMISKDSFQELMSCCPNTLSKILSELGEQLSLAS